MTNYLTDDDRRELSYPETRETLLETVERIVARHRREAATHSRSLDEW